MCNHTCIPFIGSRYCSTRISFSEASSVCDAYHTYSASAKTITNKQQYQEEQQKQ